MKNSQSSKIRKFLQPGERVWFPPLFYLQLLTLAELLTTLRLPVFGLILHGIVLVALISHGALEQNLRNRRFLLTLTLAPLIRLLSLSLPLAGRPLVDWYFGVGALLFVGAIVTTRLVGFGFRRIGFRWGNVPVQILFGLIGIGLGWLEYLILRPPPLAEEFTFAAIWLPALILTIFTGLLEEMIFRGIIQEAALTSYGRFGVTFVALLFAVLHVGYGSFLDVVFVFAVAMLFGVFAMKTGSLFGVTLAHSLTNIFLFLVFPFILALPPRENVLSPINTPTPTVTVTVQDLPSRAPTTTSTSRLLDLSPEASDTLEFTETETGTPTLVLTDTETPTPDLTSSALPSATPECGPFDGWVEYTIQSGDNLFRIGLAFNTTVANLQLANCLGTSTIISSGSNIYVPNVASVTVPPTSTPVNTTVPSSATGTNTSAPASSTLANSPTPTQTNTTVPTFTLTPTPTP